MAAVGLRGNAKKLILYFSTGYPHVAAVLSTGYVGRSPGSGKPCGIAVENDLKYRSVT
jgi:hypothetical protein